MCDQVKLCLTSPVWDLQKILNQIMYTFVETEVSVMQGNSFLFFFLKTLINVGFYDILCTKFENMYIK